MQEYFILDISPVQHDTYGDAVLAIANPILNMDAGKSVIVYSYENTAYFLFPRNQALINELVDIARAEKSWCPCIDNFDDTYMNSNGQPHQLVHLHMSFYYG